MNKINKLIFFVALAATISPCINGYAEERDTIGVISKVNVDKLSSQPELQLSNAMQGRAAGLITIASTGEFGEASSSFYIRGQHRGTSNNAAIVIIDGAQRSLDELIPEEIESIEILKDATAKILYGSLATNGVILVTTKRGAIRQKSVTAGVEYGIQQATRIPGFLGANDYVSLYNEASLNDGLQSFYSSADIDGYKRSAGVNDPVYPSADYRNIFLNDNASYRKATVQMTGGELRTKYAFTLGYTGGTGIEKVGSATDMNRLNLRANLDVDVTDYLKLQADVASMITLRNSGVLTDGELFSSLSTLRPNEYTFQYDPAYLADYGIALDAEEMVFGASKRNVNNLYQQTFVGGAAATRSASSEANLALLLDLNNYVPGLTAHAKVTFDDYTTLTQKQTNKYQTYMLDRYVDASGDLQKRYTMVQKTNLPKNQSISSSGTYRYLTVDGGADYKHDFDGNVLDLGASYKYMLEEKTGSAQDVKNMNIAFRASYDIKNKYMFEGTVAGMGSNKFDKGNRFFLAYSAGAAWVISNEDFLKGSDVVNNLTLKASFGHLGYDGAMSYFLYNTNWKTNGSLSWRQSLSGSKAALVRLGNPDLKWEYSDEANIGLTGRLFNNRLFFEANVFTESRKNIIGINNAAYSAVVGEFLPYENVGEVLNRGFEAAISWSGANADGFSYTIGANATFTRNSLVSTTEVIPEESYLNPVGRPTSTIFGLESAGLYGKEASISGSTPASAFGAFGNGDIAYNDLNGDKVIDDRDRKSIGQEFPTATFGIDIDLNYKGFGLYILGTAETGLTKMLTNNYFWNYGQNSYSNLAKDSWNATRNPQGTQPRLTTTENMYNYQNSTFWAADGSFFRLKNVELSYTLKSKGIINGYKFFVRGSNLLVLSAIKDVDPELVNAGVTNNPVFRTVTGGLNISF